MTKVFIDGSAGTTGLRIYERLENRNDIQLITIPEELRKDINARRDALNSADIVFLCLPDNAATEAVGLIDNPDTAVIDTSTAHRTNPAWIYGFAELCGYREKIAKSKRIANPGCHASGFIALIEPLVQNKIIDSDTQISCFSLTGYSGGGKKMIAEYEDEANANSLKAPRMYGLSQQHKHLAEMTKICGLANPPAFCPTVSSYYAGMEVVIPLFANQIKGSLSDIENIYKDYYQNGVIRFTPSADENGFLSADIFCGRDDMQISVFGSEERILLVSRFDNLGKGASGAAVQNMNILLGIDETTGLNIQEV